MRERLHILRAKTTEFPRFNPRPSTDVRNGVFALAIAGEVFARGAGIFARELDLEDAVDAHGFVVETFDCVFCVLSVSNAASFRPFFDLHEVEKKVIHTRVLLF